MVLQSLANCDQMRIPEIIAELDKLARANECDGCDGASDDCDGCTAVQILNYLGENLRNDIKFCQKLSKARGMPTVSEVRQSTVE